MNTHVRDNLNALWIELQYTEITATVTAASTTESSPTTVIAGASLAVVAKPLLIEFFAPYISSGSSGTTYVTLWEGATQKGRIATATGEYYTTGGNGWQGGVFSRRYTPSAGSYVFKVGCHYATAAGQIFAGAGGTAQDAPAYLRISQQGSA